MTMSRVRSSLLGSILVTTTLVACGGGAGSEFDQGSDGGAGGTFGNPGTTPTFGGGGGDGGSGGGGGIDAACVTASAKAESTPVYLVFMFDRSGSMKDSSKWSSCATGIKAFFGDAASAGVQASLQFFASADECNVAGYTAPAVAMRALPDGATFGTAIDAISPSGGTPTRPALEGAIGYAKQVQTQHPDGKVAIVLVTDGEPNDCSSSVNNVAALAGTVAQAIPTYVIGVGSSLTNLNQIAKGGGTSQAILVSTTTPASITTDFEKAIGQIKQQALSCEYKIPAPPSGQTLDAANVNVLYTAGSGASDTLTYNKDCTGAGWRYDDAAAPTKVFICPTSCDAVKNDKTGRIDVLFGCATKGGVVR
jgi:uncharacterized protein YegL